jgi:hypothetical protein
MYLKSTQVIFELLSSTVALTDFKSCISGPVFQVMQISPNDASHMAHVYSDKCEDLY